MAGAICEAIGATSVWYAALFDRVVGGVERGYLNVAGLDLVAQGNSKQPRSG
jgi:hypothetical protein